MPLKHGETLNLKHQIINHQQLEQNFKRASVFPAQSCNSIQITGTLFISSVASATKGANIGGNISVAVVAPNPLHKISSVYPSVSITSIISISLRGFVLLKILI